MDNIEDCKNAELILLFFIVVTVGRHDSVAIYRTIRAKHVFNLHTVMDKRMKRKFEESLGRAKVQRTISEQTDM